MAKSLGCSNKGTLSAHLFLALPPSYIFQGYGLHKQNVTTSTNPQLLCMPGYRHSKLKKWKAWTPLPHYLSMVFKPQVNIMCSPFTNTSVTELVILSNNLLNNLLQTKQHQATNRSSFGHPLQTLNMFSLLPNTVKPFPVENQLTIHSEHMKPMPHTHTEQYFESVVLKHIQHTTKWKHPICSPYLNQPHFDHIFLGSLEPFGHLWGSTSHIPIEYCLHEYCDCAKVQYVLAAHVSHQIYTAPSY